MFFVHFYDLESLVFTWLKIKSMTCMYIRAVNQSNLYSDCTTSTIILTKDYNDDFNCYTCLYVPIYRKHFYFGILIVICIITSFISIFYGLLFTFLFSYFIACFPDCMS